MTQPIPQTEIARVEECACCDQPAEFTGEVTGLRVCEWHFRRSGASDNQRLAEQKRRRLESTGGVKEQAGWRLPSEPCLLPAGTRFRCKTGEWILREPAQFDGIMIGKKDLLALCAETKNQTKFTAGARPTEISFPLPAPASPQPDQQAAGKAMSLVDDPRASFSRPREWDCDKTFAPFPSLDARIAVARAELDMTTEQRLRKHVHPGRNFALSKRDPNQ